MVTRRDVLSGIAASSAVIPLAGCSGSSGGSGNTTTEQTTETTTDGGGGGGGGSDSVTVAVGPEKRLRFEPEDVEIPVGGTVTWEFESVGHNVSSLPDASPKCQVPEGAEPFASYENGNHFAVNEKGSTFSHTFEVPGKYVYVCVPHAGQGMVGTVTVTE
ncbi:MAG: plastocyanin/azurin family copper-binding protein [Halodesulfurarchaeum sp.]